MLALRAGIKSIRVRYFHDAGKLAERILEGGYEVIASVPRKDIMMKYDNK